MDRKKLIGIVAIGGGLLWYMNSQSQASTLPAATTTASTTTTTTGGTDGSDATGGGSTDETPPETTETTDGSDDASTVDPADCSKYRAAHHEAKKVWMSSTQTKEWTQGSYVPHGVKMDDFATGQEQYFINQEVDWSLKLSVKNTSKDQCGEGGWPGYVDKKCWLPPGADGAAYGNDCCLSWTVTWTDPQENTYTDDSGTITRPSTKPKDGGSVWSTLNGKFRIPNVESSIGVWKVAIEYKYKDKGSVSWDGPVFWVVPESCAEDSSAAETFKSDFARPIFAPRITQQSFMQF